MSGHSAHPFGNRMVVFGGLDAGKEEVFNVTYVLDISTLEWRTSGATGRIPEKRNSHQMVAVGSSLYLFGGSSPEEGAMNDFFRLDVLGETRLL